MKTVNLPKGHTAYELSGEGPLLVLIHGLSTPAFVWDAIIPYLHNAGYATLRYDLYGRGGSAAGHKRYDADLYSAQLFDLFDALGISEPVHLVGYSMGGGIVACAALQEMRRVKSATLLGPTGFKTALEESWPILRFPIYGAIHIELFGGAEIRMGARKDAKDLGLTSNIAELQAEATYKPGFMRALRKSIKHGPMTGLEDTHKALANAGLPMLAIWGGKDTVIPISGRDKLAAINPNARQVTLEEATHAFAYTHEAKVAEHLLDFLGSL